MAGSVDPEAGFAALLSVFVGTAAAAQWAPHLTVFFVGMAGGVLGVMSWRKCTRREAIAYVLAMGLFAWLLAQYAASVLGAVWKPAGGPNAILLCALCIGWVGHRWELILKAATKRIKGAIDGAKRAK